MKIESNNIIVEVKTTDRDITFSSRVEHIEDEVNLVHITAESEQSRQMPEMSIFLSQDAVDVSGSWHPLSRMDKGLGLDWGYPLKSWATTSAPTINFYNQKGFNRLSVAFSDVINTIMMETGGSDDSCSVTCKAILFTKKTKKLKKYSITLRLDTRDIPYYEAIQGVSKWWSSMDELKPISVPETALEPVFSSWYNYHQEITDKIIESSCIQAREYGFSSVIVDDGWQTDNNQRGYGYCGDWDVFPGKIPDMAAHVERVHQIGLKYILWYAVPFVGKFTRAWDKFQGKMLYIDDVLATCVVDPRYPDVREYIFNTYIDAIENWKVDGFKLDFVNMFYLKDPEEAHSTAPGKDHENVQEAIDLLLSTLVQKLKEINPDILIEFRQSYIGPAMRKYGNMFRVSDCPLNPDKNRIGITDIRLISDTTPAHGDMLIWSPQSTIENAALQIINTLFGVLQISLDFTQYPENHLQMMTFWMDFMKTHKDVLLHGDFKPLFPEFLYPLIIAETAEKKIIASYSQYCIDLEFTEKQKVWLINGTLENQVILNNLSGDRLFRIEKFNCYGKKTSSESVQLNQGVHMLDVDGAGFLTITL